MTQARVEWEGEALAATVQRKDGAVTVELDGQTYTFRVAGDGTRRTVTGEEGAWTVERQGRRVLVDGAEVPLRVLGLAGKEGLADRQGAARVRPPMAGRVESVRVRAGQAVQKGDVLLVLEAMKMLNEVRAPVSGTVTAVNVQPGATVETSQVLLELGPQ